MELGDLAGLPGSAISHFETGRRSPSFANLRKLADALGVSTDYLLGREPTPGLAGPRADALLRSMGEMSESSLSQLARYAEFLRRGGADDENS